MESAATEHPCSVKVDRARMRSAAARRASDVSAHRRRDSWLVAVAEIGPLTPRVPVAVDVACCDRVEFVVAAQPADRRDDTLSRPGAVVSLLKAPGRGLVSQRARLVLEDPVPRSVLLDRVGALLPELASGVGGIGALAKRGGKVRRCDGLPEFGPSLAVEHPTRGKRRPAASGAAVIRSSWANETRMDGTSGSVRLRCAASAATGPSSSRAESCGMLV